MGNTSDSTSTTFESEPIELVHPSLNKTSFKKTTGREVIEAEVFIHSEQVYDQWVEDVENNPGTDMD